MWFKIVSVLLFFPFLTLAKMPVSEEKALFSVPVLIAEDVKLQLERLSKTTDILTIRNFNNLPQGRDLVDVILLNQALYYGECNCQLKYFDNSVYGRNIELLKSGEFAMSADTLWLSDINRHPDFLLSSEPVINNGEYDVGLYTSENNNKALNAKNLADISRLTAISNRFWTADWQAINQLKPSKLAHIESFPNMKRLVKSEIADYTLMHFRIKDNQLNYENLTPIPNVKAVLWDSRHFALSKHFAHSHTLSEAINKGLQYLFAKNIIRPAYQAVGINHPVTQGWAILNENNSQNSHTSTGP